MAIQMIPSDGANCVREMATRYLQSTQSFPLQPLQHPQAPKLKVGGFRLFADGEFPGQDAAMVLVQGCPWRCSYCGNPQLQLRTIDSPLDWDDILDSLQVRFGTAGAVVFGGGEPCVDPALPQALQAVRALGLKTGLQTAGIYPERLQKLLPLLDWVGLDIKGGDGDYASITGIRGSARVARKSLKLLLASGVDYEVRTTIHPDLLSEAKLLALAQNLAQQGVKNYALQVFREQGCRNAALCGAKCGSGDAVIINACRLADAQDMRYPGAALLKRMSAMFPQFSVRR